MKKSIYLFLLILALVPVKVCSQSVYPGLFEERIVVDEYPAKAKPVNLKNVRLLPSRFRENMQRDSAWINSIETDRLLHSFYNNSGVWGGREGGYMTVKKYGGWESLDCELRGHTTGHLMSATALMYAATGDSIFKAKGDSIVEGLGKVQKALGNGYLSAFPEELINRNIRGESVWAPWYTLHKILCGLIDQYLYAHNDNAFQIAKYFGDWAYFKLKDIPEETRIKMLRNEFGGMNEAFYNLYALTGDKKYFVLGEFFRQEEVVTPLANRDNDFGTKHTNTFIPKVLGEMRRYEITGDTASLNLSRFFWDEMIGHHVFAPGCLSDKEHYFPVNLKHEHLSGYTGETCCTYNMLKLGRHIFAAGPEAEIFDYYERALYNHILGQQDPESGMVAYFLPLGTGTHRVYSTPENSFWCCVGSGFESHAKYAESIYFSTADNKGLFVNLFIPSKVNDPLTGFEISQNNNFPAERSTTLTIEKADKGEKTLYIRKPNWADKIGVSINGKPEKFLVNRNNYISLKREWKAGDKVLLDFDFHIEAEPLESDRKFFSLTYGPLILAGRLGTEGMETPAPFSNPMLYNDYYTYNFNIPEGIDDKLTGTTELKAIGNLRWETPKGIIVEPFNDIHRERYIVYWKNE